MFLDHFEWQGTSRWLMIRGWCHLQDPLGALVCAFGLLSAGGVLMFIEPLHVPWTTSVFDVCLEGWLVPFLHDCGIGIGQGQGSDRSFCRQVLKLWTTQAPSNSLPYTDHRCIGICTLFLERRKMRSDKSIVEASTKSSRCRACHLCGFMFGQGHSPVGWQVVPYQRWWHHKATIHAPAATALAAGTAAWAQNDKRKLCCVLSS